jgi:RNA polymerase sigma factor (sigma-70 family)
VSRPTPDEPAPDLLQRAQAGDPAAGEALVRWCYPRVRRWAYVRTGDLDDADDVTQEVIVGLSKRLAGFEGRSRFTTWLYRLTVNTAGAGLRRRLRRAGLLARRPVPAPVDEEAAALSALHRDDLAALARTLMHELPARQRTAFDLVDLQGYEAAEAAAMLSVDPVTVRAHLTRARRTLRELMLADRPSLAEDA